MDSASALVCSLAVAAAVGALASGCSLDTSGQGPALTANGGTATSGGPAPGGSGMGGNGIAGGLAGGGMGGAAGAPSPGGSGGNGGQGGEGGSCDFTSPNTCASAQQLTSISGHEGSETRSESGVGSMWYEIFVSETFGHPGEPLSYTASLTSPPGMDYDVYVYEGDTNGSSVAQPDCAATPIQGDGTPESVISQWPETPSSDNDGRWVSVEVRHMSGALCGEGSSWDLTIIGNTQ